jgi:hypothetical protein
MNTSARPGPAEILLYVVGLAGVIWGLWKGKIDGFYMSEAPLLIGVLAASVVLLLIAGRVTTRRKRAAADEADRSRGV